MSEVSAAAAKRITRSTLSHQDPNSVVKTTGAVPTHNSDLKESGNEGQKHGKGKGVAGRPEHEGIVTSQSSAGPLPLTDVPTTPMPNIPALCHLPSPITPSNAMGVHCTPASSVMLSLPPTLSPVRLASGLDCAAEKSSFGNLLPLPSTPPLSRAPLPSTPSSSSRTSLPSTPSSSSAASMPRTPVNGSMSYWETKMRGIRDNLLAEGGYLGDPKLNVRQAFQWVQFENGRILCTREVAAAYDQAYAIFKDDVVAVDPPPAPDAVNLSGVYRIDEALFFMTADGNWNPKQDFGGFEESKATCLLAAAHDSVFAKDYPLMNKNINTLVKMGVSGDNRVLRGIFNVTDDGRKLLKLRHVLFEANEIKEANEGEDDVEGEVALSEDDQVDGDGTDDYALDDLLQVTANGGRHLTQKEEREFLIRGWPVKKRVAKEELAALFNSHQVTPIIAFDISGDRILPSTYEAQLKGADVQVHFNMLHWAFGYTKKPSTLSDTIVADLANMRIIVPGKVAPSHSKSSPRKKRVWQKDVFTPQKKVRGV
ncbi:hypothetical protein PHLCEN_2v3975 [Hermanssonia centrifuga]|uniref:Uncharacterized protein n=1 Tax=Hermanssonia centrifuga TaxID=98765 RepID=A0A2R6Q7J7_9APHY|nr:hypothetical protein PHLCEN_2v3975 [Hermanssonia centrifuga]